MAELEKELKESIAYFEQILSVLPGDRTALAFLAVAYEQLGDAERSLAYNMALAEVVIREKDAKEAAELVEKLKLLEDPRAKATVLKLQVVVAPPPELKFERPIAHDTCAQPDVAAKAEIALLQRLVEDGVLHASLVRTAFDQLESLPTNQENFLISALLILEKENLAGATDALAAVADAAHAPPIPLESFEIVPGNVRKLPEKLVKVRGVIPFAQLGTEWAVAMLNPLDEALRIEVTEALGARCHFFLALPGTIEKVLERVFSGEDEEAAAGMTPTPVAPKAEPVADEPPPVVNPIQ